MLHHALLSSALLAQLKLCLMIMSASISFYTCIIISACKDFRLKKPTHVRFVSRQKYPRSFRLRAYVKRMIPMIMLSLTENFPFYKHLLFFLSLVLYSGTCLLSAYSLLLKSNRNHRHPPRFTLAVLSASILG